MLFNCPRIPPKWSSKLNMLNLFPNIVYDNRDLLLLPSILARPVHQIVVTEFTTICYIWETGGRPLGTAWWPAFLTNISTGPLMLTAYPHSKANHPRSILDVADTPAPQSVPELPGIWHHKRYQSLGIVVPKMHNSCCPLSDLFIISLGKSCTGRSCILGITPQSRENHLLNHQECDKCIILHAIALY